MVMTALGFAAVGVLFALLLLLVGRRLSRRIDNSAARRPFESGAPPAVHAWNRYHPRFLTAALVFMLCQTLGPVLLAWANVARSAGLGSVILMGVFVLLTVVGLVYAWRERAFEWD